MTAVVEDVGSSAAGAVPSRAERPTGGKAPVVEETLGERISNFFSERSGKELVA